jgi:hypothetical protein
MDGSCGARFTVRESGSPFDPHPAEEQIVTTVSFVSSVRKRLTIAGRASAAGLACLWLIAACTSGEEVYNARLSRFPEVGGNPAGDGTATATLRGTTLEVSGAYQGLTHQAGRGGGDPSPTAAMAVRLRAGEVTGVPGEPLFDLSLEPGPDGGASGTISGSVELTPGQVELLREGSIYAQIDSEAAPNGHLWGWFLQ